MSPIVARSVASFYGCKPNFKIVTYFRSVCYTSFCVVGPQQKDQVQFWCIFMANILESIKKY